MKGRMQFILRWSLWCAVGVFVSLTNMNVWDVSEIQRAGLNFVLMLIGNLLWLWQVSSAQERHQMYSRMIVWNGSYTLITFLVPPVLLGVGISPELVMGSLCLAVGLLLFSNPVRISKLIRSLKP